MFPVAVHVVRVDVVGARHAVRGRQDDARVVVCNDVRVAVLWLVHLHVRVVPRELLAGLDRLELLREVRPVIALQKVDVVGEVGDGNGRVTDHGCGQGRE